MIYLKSKSVNLNDVHHKVYSAIAIVAQIYEAHGSDLVITSVRDSKHGKHSLHYVGKAFDIRIWNIKVDKYVLGKELQKALGDEYDVVVEKDHIHIEYDPK